MFMYSHFFVLTFSHFKSDTKTLIKKLILMTFLLLKPWNIILQ